MNKRGQFFLMAALIIAGIIITLTTINISTKTSEGKTTAFYDLSKEINFESNSLIDYGVFHTASSGTIGDSLESLAANYSVANPDADLLIVYGNRTDYNIVLYNKTSTGRDCVGPSCNYPFIRESTPLNPPFIGNNVTVALDNETNLTFTLEPEEQNFFIVLKQEVGGEKIIAQSPNE